MPVSAKTAAAIIRSLGGPAMPAEWKDGLGVDVGGVGPGPTLVNFTYQVYLAVLFLYDYY
jgi:N-acetylated-alpha-linked acidic dipeptidase